MIVGNEFIISKYESIYTEEKIFFDSESAIYYVKQHIADFNARKIISNNQKVKNLLGKAWQGLFSFKFCKDVDTWLSIGGTLCIDRNLDTYISFNTNKANKDYSKGRRTLFYFKFNKSIVTKICETAMITKEQACALLQVFAIEGKETPLFEKMCVDYADTSRYSVIRNIIKHSVTPPPNVQNAYKNICDYIYDYFIISINMCNIFDYFSAWELDVCSTDKLDTTNLLWSFRQNYERISCVRHVKDDVDSTWMLSLCFTFDESDDLIYSDNLQKVIEQKGFTDYLDKKSIINRSNYMRDAIINKKTIDGYDFEITPSNIAGLSHFGNKLSRIL